MAREEGTWQDRVLDAWNQRVEDASARFREFLDEVANQTRKYEWSLEELPFGVAKGIVRVTLKTLQ